MQALAGALSAQFHRASLGRTAPVLFESEADGVFDGLTDTYIRVYTDAPVSRGEMVPMHLVRLHRDGVWGVPYRGIKNP